MSSGWRLAAHLHKAHNWRSVNTLSCQQPTSPLHLPRTPPLAVDLLSFAMLTWVLAPPNIKAKLVTHFVTDPSGRYMLDAYTGKNREQWEQPSSSSSSGAVQLPAAAAGMRESASFYAMRPYCLLRMN